MNSDPIQGINRRQFLKGAAAIGTSISLNSLWGCSTTIKETRQELKSQKWSSNPILPIPDEGCYLAFQYSFQIPAILKIDYYKELLGAPPAYSDISSGKFGAKEENFPTRPCEEFVEMGVLPGFKYGMDFQNGIEDIVKGRKDKVIEEFAKKAYHFGKPYIFVPFKEMNMNSREYWNHGGEQPKVFIKAWRQMHRIFGDVGANHNTIWAVHFFDAVGRKHPLFSPPQDHYPGDDVVDIIAFTIGNRIDFGEGFRHFNDLFYNYDWARTEHKTKPVAILEFSQSNNPRQHEFIRKAYADVKDKFPAIKIVQWVEGIWRFRGMMEDMRFSTNPKSVQAMKEVLKDPYFISGPLMFLNK